MNKPSSHVVQTRLPNGFRIATEAIAGAQTVAFAISVGVGARYETMAQHGISHLLEHMAFKGTPTHNARGLAEAFDLMGGNVNAYTSNESTVYYVKVLKNYAEEALQLLCDIVHKSIIDESELERERGVILQELAMHNDTPDDLVFDHFHALAYTKQPLGRSILGTEDSISTHSRTDICDFIAQHYVPSRMVLTAAGAIDNALCLRIANETFGVMPTQIATPFSPAHYTGGTLVTYKKSLEQVQLVLGYQACATTHKDTMALRIFSILLGGGMSSRLFQEIREKRGLVYSISAFASNYQDTGLLSLYAATGAEHLPELMPALSDILAHAGEHISELELLRAKNQMKAGVVMARESIGSIAEWMGRHLLTYGTIKTAEEILTEIDALTLLDMERIANTYIGKSALTMAALGPVKSINHSILPQSV